jgi:hypothetical protein
MFDSVSSALDNASQMLAGGAPGSGGGASGTAKYIRGVDIDKEEGSLPDATTPNLANVRDMPLIIEFIHFGRVHTSRSNVFPHKDYKDAELIADLPENARPRAIQFRAGLEREVILLSTFMQATQTVLDEREKEKGALGSAMGAISSIAGIGGGGGGGGAPASAGDVNSHLEKVKSAAGKINAATIEYKVTHKAGMDIHKARADYRAFLDKVIQEKPEAGPDSLLGKMPGLSSVAGPIGDVIAVAQGIAFKAQDIRVKFFANVAKQQEPAVETACHDMTISAITTKYNPFLPVWFPKPDAPAAEKGPDKKYDDNFIGDAEKKIDETKQKVDDAVSDVKDFFAPVKRKEAPGEPFLGQAFAAAAPPDKSFVPMEMGNLTCKAFADALGKPLPGFVEGIVRTILAVSIELLHGALESVIFRDPSTPILGKDLYEGARHRMFQKVIALAIDKVGFLKTAKNFQLNLPVVQAVKPSNFAEKGLDKVEELVNEKIGAYLDIPLKEAMGKFADQLELARQQGMKEKCHTMECYLGRLPWMQASLFCNLFFPFWDALMDVITGVLDSALAGPLGAIKSAASKAKGLVDSGRDALAQADAVKKKAQQDMDALSQGISAADVISGKSNVGKGYGDAMDSKAAAVTGPQINPGKFDFPLQGRIDQGKADELKKSQYDEVKGNHQWETAEAPPETPDKQDNEANDGGDKK